MALELPSYPPLEARPIKNTIVLFDVDETLTKARRAATPEMLQALQALRQKVAIGYVGGSDLSKQQEQLGTADRPVTSMFDFCFSENGLTAFKMGAALPSNSFIKWIGEDRYKELVSWCLHYIADLDTPIKRGTFVEFRNGMVNVSPLGRNATNQERLDFNEYDNVHKVRETMVAKLKEKFGHLGLTYVSYPYTLYLSKIPTHNVKRPPTPTSGTTTGNPANYPHNSFSIGGAISFDVFPTGWDKTYCLKHLEDEARKPGGVSYTTVHFYGDKTMPGGNDYEIYSDPRTKGHSVDGPDDTLRQLKEEWGI
ncbi:Uu.00g039190.m01.CDS01 [Anthostomella pinea]|uniref:Phosphomannomutase n=1 Tax=Anthostomella pinea TaxID=933095 RepID=A0AAI8V9Z6_9PEZI|nr:Uu.00g039190.m01.CDS01 [Anthostomella pinea]